LKLFGRNSLGVTTTLEEVDYGKKNDLHIVYGNVEKISELNLASDFEYIWANNLFEHLLSPHAFLVRLKTVSSESTHIILGVPVIPKITSLIKWKYFRGVMASNHINFFTHTSLGLTVERAGWNVACVRPFIFKNYFLDSLARPFAPHVYVVAKNDSHFKYPPKKIKEWVEDPHYKELLIITGQK